MSILAKFNPFGQRSRAERKQPSSGFASRGLLQAAQAGRTEASWGTTPNSADTNIFHNWTPIVARAREAALDNDYIRNYLKMVRDNVVGPKGFQLLPQIKDLDTGNSDRLAGDAIQAAYKEFSHKGNFDATGTMSRADFEALVAMTWATDGEAFIVRTTGPNAGPWGFSWQLRDATLLEVTHNEVLPSGNVIRFGIEYDANTWRPVRYHFRRYAQEQLDYVATYGSKYEIVDARDVIHVFRPEMTGQKRGLSQVRTAIWRLRMLKGFQDAAVTNAEATAEKLGIIKDPDGTNTEDEELEINSERASFLNIGNREFSPFTSQFPDSQTGPFCADMLRGSSAGLGVSYASLASDLTGVNFSSIRQGALDEREAWKGIQEWFVEACIRPMYESWLSHALLRERIKVNGRPLKPERIEKYKQVAWQGRRWSWIDPASEMAAHEKALALKLETRSSIIRDNGRDPDDVFHEISDEEGDMRDYGLDPTIHQPGATPNATGKTDNTNETAK
jgi:lambda family phage portal protein